MLSTRTVGGALGAGSSSSSKKKRTPNHSITNVPFTGAPREYARTGTGRGTEKSTESGRTSALAQFDIFLATKHMKPWKACVENDICSIPLLQEFGTFLSFDAGK